MTNVEFILSKITFLFNSWKILLVLSCFNKPWMTHPELERSESTSYLPRMNAMSPKLLDKKRKKLGWIFDLVSVRALKSIERFIWWLGWAVKNISILKSFRSTKYGLGELIELWNSHSEFWVSQSEPSSFVILQEFLRAERKWFRNWKKSLRKIEMSYQK